MLLDVVTTYPRVSLSALADQLTDNYDVSYEQALTDVATFVAAGQRAGLLSYHPSTSSSLRLPWLMLQRVLLFPIFRTIHPPSVRRQYFAFSVPRTVVLTLWAQIRVGIFLVLPVVSLIISSAEMPAELFALAVAAIVSFVLAVVVLGVAHELAHVLATHIFDIEVSAVYAQGLRVGLHRARSTPVKDLIISVAGPLAALLLCIIITIVVVSIDGTDLSSIGRPALVGVWLAGSLQLACLVPPSADGRAIARAVGRAKQPLPAGGIPGE